MYIGSWKIDDFVTFVCNTHTPATGAATDDDSVPIYRIYEDETTTPILTGSMAKLDDANTTGYYSERIQLTAANGFEKGKCYHIYIEATVGVTGTTSRFFQIEAEVDANVVSDKTGYGLADNAITAAKVAANAIGASELAADAVTEIQSGLATAAALTAHDGKLDTVSGNVDDILLSTGTDGVALSTAVKQAIADELLKRGVSNVEDAADAHSLAALILAALESVISGTTWTIRKTGGTTFDTKTVTTDPAANPIIGVT